MDKFVVRRAKPQAIERTARPKKQLTQVTIRSLKVGVALESRPDTPMIDNVVNL